MAALSLRTRVVLADEGWLPGEPLDDAPDVAPWVPVIDDGVPLKEHADVFVRDDPGLRDHALVIRIDEASVPQVALAVPGWAPTPSLRDRVSVRVPEEIEVFQRAAPEWRSVPFGEGARLGWDLDGIPAASGVVDFAIAALVHTDDDEAILVEMVCDSVVVDAARGEAELVWRGIFRDPAWGGETSRIVIGVLPRGVPEDAREAILEAGLGRARFTRAANAEDIAAQRSPPALGDEDVAMARMTAWEKGPGDARLGADEFALASSELARGPRHEVLARLGFDEISWGLEEWAQGEQRANESASFASEASEADEVEETGEGRPEGGVSLPAPPSAAAPPGYDRAAYARLSAHLAVRDPGRVLAEAKLSIGDYIALEQGMQIEIEHDDALADEIDRLRSTFDEEVARAHAADLAQLGLDLEDDPPAAGPPR